MWVKMFGSHVEHDGKSEIVNTERKTNEQYHSCTHVIHSRPPDTYQMRCLDTREQRPNPVPRRKEAPRLCAEEEIDGGGQCPCGRRQLVALRTGKEQCKNLLKILHGFDVPPALVGRQSLVAQDLKYEGGVFGRRTDAGLGVVVGVVYQQRPGTNK